MHWALRHPYALSAERVRRARHPYALSAERVLRARYPYVLSAERVRRACGCCVPRVEVIVRNQRVLKVTTD